MNITQDNPDLKRIEHIDQMFESATNWGSWMVMCANEREALVNKLNAQGYTLKHKYLARTPDGGRTD